MSAALASILLVDPSPDIRSALRILIDSMPGCTVVGETAVRSDALLLARALLRGVVIVAGSLAAPGGHRFLRELRQVAPLAAILVYSGDDRPVCVERARAHGACAYVVTGSTIEILEAAIRAALVHQSSFPHDPLG